MCNIPIENKTLINSQNIPCPFKNNGCAFDNSTFQAVIDHAKICYYRTFICPRFGSENCQNVCLRNDDALDHLLLFHEANILYGPVQTVKRTLDLKFFTDYTFFSAETHWPAMDIHFNRKHFFAEFFTIKGRVSWSILIVDSEDEAWKYRARITCGSNKGREIQWTIPVRSVKQGKILRDRSMVDERFLPSLDASEFKDFVETDAAGSSYEFNTRYEIMLRTP